MKGEVCANFPVHRHEDFAFNSKVSLKDRIVAPALK